MKSIRRFSLLNMLLMLLIPVNALSAGSEIQFSITLKAPMSHQDEKLASGRYLVTVQKQDETCQFEFRPVNNGVDLHSEPVSIPGLCGIGNKRELKKPVIRLVPIDKTNVSIVYFETPYKAQGRSFYAAARLTQ